MENNNQSGIGKLLAISLAILLVGSVSFVAFLKNKDFFLGKNKIEEVKTASDRQELSSRNDDFSRAESLIAKNPSEALESYKKSLLEAESQEDIDAISFRIALATYRSGNIGGGIDLFKEIIASSSISNVTKAYSVQIMVQEYYATNSSSLFNTIFSGKPYENYLSGNDKEYAMRELIEYGKSFYPLPILSLRSADFKAKDLFSKKDLSQSQKDLLVSQIKEDVMRADAGVEALKKSKNIDQLPVIYNRKLLLYSNMKKAGYVLGDSHEAYEKGVDFANLYNDRNTLMFLHLNYSITLLANGGVVNSEEIKSVLKNIVEEKEKSLKIFEYLKNKSYTDPKIDEGAKFITELAKIDPSFKNLLLSLGWKI